MMTTMSEEQLQDWDDIAAGALEEPTVDRRRLLRSGAGGLAVAASGLFLPAWLTETEAREGALGGAKGGRRGNDHKGRHKKRTHGNKKGSPGGDAPRGSGDAHLRWITFHLYNDRPVASPNPSVAIAPWVETTDGWGHFPNSTIPNGGMKSFRMRSAYRAAMIIDNRYYVAGINYLVGTPQVVLAYGGTMSATGYTNPAKPPYVRTLAQNEEFTRSVDGHPFTIKRIADSDDYIEFDVHFT